MYAHQQILRLALALGAFSLLPGCGYYLIPGRFQPLDVAQQQASGEGASM
jgi:hypothetical protein